MIKGHELENREGMPRGSAEADEAIRQVKGRRPKIEVADEVHGDPGATPLADRLDAARALRPPKAIHCGCCFGQGRDAAIQAIEGGGG